MIKASDLTKVARIDAGLCFEPGFDGKVEDFARKFALWRIELPGKADLGKSSYEKAKICVLAAARTGSARQGARVSSFNSKGWLEPIMSFCRVTRKKFLGE